MEYINTKKVGPKPRLNSTHTIIEWNATKCKMHEWNHKIQWSKIIQPKRSLTIKIINLITLMMYGKSVWT